MESSRSAGMRTHWQYKNNQAKTPTDKNTQTQTICIGIYTRANLKTFQTQKTTRAMTTMKRSPKKILSPQQKRQILAAAIAESIAKNMRALCILANR